MHEKIDRDISAAASGRKKPWVRPRVLSLSTPETYSGKQRRNEEGTFSHPRQGTYILGPS